ncbi:hypothetical protein O9K51_05635 [Purpureocillium lavendulum]|uniref:CFEM domain-containing protein n=1 Tax=Purpureocillium lavendulum TaxID=1247861 RepID=A0AB34FTC0_9HYPO|nr:hypothetical protein O9K51_05635 [Purpureocillium lavendulum]
MKAVSILATLVSVAFAQSLNDIDACARPALEAAIQKNKCDLIDLKCACSKFDQIRADATKDIIEACGEKKTISTFNPTAPSCHLSEPCAPYGEGGWLDGRFLETRNEKR